MYRRAAAEGGVAREGDARTRDAAGVPEDHPLEGHRRAKVLGDVVHAPVLTGPGRLPGGEHRKHCRPQLLERILRQLLARHPDEALEMRAGELLERARGQLPRALRAGGAQARPERLLKGLARGPVDDRGIRFDEAPVGVPRKPRVAV